MDSASLPQEEEHLRDDVAGSRLVYERTPGGALVPSST